MSSNNSWNSQYNSAIGDLLVGNGTRPVVVPVGADGTALVADSGQPEGVTWGFPSGVITNAQQPAFSAQQTVNALNATGNGTIFTIIYDSILGQQGTNYNSATGVFTAPVTGYYQFNASILVSNLGAAHTLFEAFFTRNAGANHFGFVVNPFVTQSASGLCMYNIAALISLTAADTVAVRTFVSGGAQTVTVQGGPVFSGVLVC